MPRHFTWNYSIFNFLSALYVLMFRFSRFKFWHLDTAELRGSTVALRELSAAG
ncbi:UNVERIFIED_ORG: hypothetical protein J2W66_002327 [Agrobacterium larrymoorei]|nr:hypothetical protein [Agrobacterium larrymoorei]